MSQVECSNCGRPILTEADRFIYQHIGHKKEDYYSCGCKENAEAEEIRNTILKSLSYPTDDPNHESVKLKTISLLRMKLDSKKDLIKMAVRITEELDEIRELCTGLNIVGEDYKDALDLVRDLVALYKTQKG